MHPFPQMHFVRVHCLVLVDKTRLLIRLDVVQSIYHTTGPSNVNPGIANSSRLRLFGLVEPLLFWTVRLPMSHQFLMGWGE